MKLLELSGYIEYTEEIDNASRVMFIATRDELYQYTNQDRLTDSIIQTILRSYTGVFADYAYINESEIATKSGTTPDEVYQRLVGLSKVRIIQYVPHKKTPLIIYRQPREDQKYLTIPRSAYEERKAKIENRIEKVIGYLEENSLCRARFLLDYFGEHNADDCGSCDICLAKHDSGLTNREINKIRSILLDCLQEGPMGIREVLENLPYPEEKCFTAIRWLIDNTQEIYLENDRLCRQ